MLNPWLALSFQALKLAMESQNVIALRLARVAGGGVPAFAEGNQMFAEKAAAFGEAQFAISQNLLAGGDGVGAAHKVLAIYNKRVSANSKRLSRR